MKNVFYSCFFSLTFCFASNVLAKNIIYDDINNYCIKQMPNSAQQCNNLIIELEKSSLIEDKLKLATAYLHKSHTTKDSKIVSQLQAKAKLAYQQALKIEPNNIEALTGSTLFESNSKKIAIFKKILRLAPHKSISYSFLTESLLKGTESEKQEAIELLDSAYRRFNGNERWNFAKQKYGVLLRLGRIEQAKAFKHTVLTDMANEQRNKFKITPKASQISSLCNYYSFHFGTQSNCLNEMLALTVNHLSKTSDIESITLLNAIDSALTEKHQMLAIEPNFINRLNKLIKNSEINSDDPKLMQLFNLVCAQLSFGKEKLDYLKKATSYSAAQPGKAEYWLANELMKQGEKESSINLYQALVEYGTAPYNQSASLKLQYIDLKKAAIN